MALEARLSRLIITALVSIASTLALAVGALAESSETTPLCGGAASQVFLRWLDPAYYRLAPGGDFEARTSWSLAGGAKIVNGNEPFRVGRATDARSLSIPAGASATTPAICIGLGDPTLRFFAVGGATGSGLRVEAIYDTALGRIVQPVGSVSSASAWAPTPLLPLLANVTGLTSLDGLTSSVRLRFTAGAAAGWRIDDVYVDPFKRH